MKDTANSFFHLLLDYGEGISITKLLQYANFYFIGAYVPNSGSGLVNLEKRGRWEQIMRQKLIDLDGKKAVIYGGDLNVAHKEIGTHFFGNE